MVVYRYIIQALMGLHKCFSVEILCFCTASELEQCWNLIRDGGDLFIVTR